MPSSPPRGPELWWRGSAGGRWPGWAVSRFWVVEWSLGPGPGTLTLHYTTLHLCCPITSPHAACQYYKLQLHTRDRAGYHSQQSTQHSREIVWASCNYLPPRCIAVMSRKKFNISGNVLTLLMLKCDLYCQRSYSL